MVTIDELGENEVLDVDTEKIFEKAVDFELESLEVKY
jgi:hypothetical protein